MAGERKCRSCGHVYESAEVQVDRDQEEALSPEHETGKDALEELDRIIKKPLGQPSPYSS